MWKNRDFYNSTIDEEVPAEFGEAMKNEVSLHQIPGHVLVYSPLDKNLLPGCAVDAPLHLQDKDGHNPHLVVLPP